MKKKSRHSENRKSRKARRRKQKRRSQRSDVDFQKLEDRQLLATVTVGTNLDVFDGDTSSVANLVSNPGADGAISLREAISAANNTAGADTVNLPAGTYILTNSGSAEDSNATGDLDILDPAGTTIVGAGADLTVIDGNAQDRVLHVRPNASAWVEGVTIQNGFVDGISSREGAGIQFEGVNLSVVDSRITNNTLPSGNHDGAGINAVGTSVGTINISGSLIDNNVAGDSGGGIDLARQNTTVSINNTTIANNTAGRGVAINGIFSNSSTVMTVTNSTIVGNVNTNSSQPILFATSADWRFANTIVSGNTGTTADAGVTSLGNNIWGENGSSGGGGFTLSTTDIVPTGSLSSFLDTNLANNGGSTDTHALVAGGVAVDAGDNSAAAALTNDQRGTGFNRVVNGTVDIGAFEFGAGVVPVNYDFTTSTYTTTEGDTTATTQVVTITRDDSSSAEDVDVILTNGTATEGDDFTAGPVTVSFAAGESTKSVEIEILGETLVEGDETINLSLANFSGSGQVGTTTPTSELTLTNDDSAVLSIANATVMETNSGTTQLVFNVSLSNPVSVDVSFDYTTVDGTAIAGQDYTATSGTLTIPAGQTSASISVDVSGDEIVELDEAFTLEPSNLQAGGLLVAAAQTAGTFATHQDVPGFTNGVGVQDIKLADFDGDGDLDGIMVGRENITSSGVLSTSILINDGSGTFSQNFIADPNNTFDNVAGGVRARVAVGDVDDDGDVDALVIHGPFSSLYNLPGTLYRNNGDATFTTETIADTNFAGEVEFSDIDGDGDLDLFVTSVAQDSRFGQVPEARVLINDGTGVFTNSGQALDDNRGEALSMGDVDGDGDQDAVVATNFGGKIFLNDGSGNFTDSGNSLGSTHNIRVSMADVDGDGDLDAITTGRDFVDGIHLNDGTGNFTETQTFGTTLSHRGSAHTLGDFDGDGDIDVFRSSINIGAEFYVNQGGAQQGTAGSFVAEAAPLPFGAHYGLASGDLNGDGFTDVIAASSSGSHGWRVYHNQPSVLPANATISNDDSATISIGDATVTEGGNLEFAVTLSQPVDVDTVITYSTTDGSATTTDSDYTGATTETITINAGQTSGTITIATGDDNTAESDETLTVSLSAVDSNGRAVSIALADGTGTIVNDDFAPVADAGGPYSISEGDGLTLDASATTDADSSTLTFRWDVDGDGDFDENVIGATPTLSAAQMDALGLSDDASVNVTVEASDGTNVNTASTTLTINNVAPAFDAGANETILPAVVGVFSRGPISFTDPGPDTWSGTVDFGDGTGSQSLTIDQVNKTFNLDHTFTVDGNYTVTVTLNDDDGGTLVETFEVNVQLNTPPVANNDDVNVEENSSVLINVLADNGNGADSDAESNIDPSLTINLTSPSAGSLTNNNDGTFTFDATGEFESLAAGQTDTVSFDYQIEDSFGQTDTATVTITINGVNDDATISGDNAGDMTEDGAGDSGVLSVADVDTGEAVFQTQSGTTGTYGDFSVDANGNWTYSRTADLNSMNAGDVLIDSFKVVSADGTATETVTITINGVNDNATISGDNAGDITEDGAVDSGVLSVADVDTGEAVFQIQSGTTGIYGDFSVDANGNWTYTRTADLNSMNAGDVLTDSFNVDSADGTATETVTITINGLNDDATISGDNVGDMTEDGTGDSGTLNVTDVDAGEAVFQTQSGTTGTYGDFSIDANGNWTYTRTADLNSMNAGDVLTDSFNVVSADGTATETVVVTINGLNDGPVLTNLTLDAVVDDTFKTGSTETRRTVNLSTTGDAAVVGQKLVLTGTFDELDSLSSHTVTVNWGDGTVETFDIADVDLNDDGRSFELVHTYSSTDDYAIDVTVDDGAATDGDTLNTTVANSSNQSGIFTVAGSNGSDVIQATRNQGNKIKIKVFRQSGFNSVFVENVADVSEISILGRGGHDFIAVSNAITFSTIIDGGAGHDVMFGGRGADKMIGGSGNDVMIGRAGDDVMLGGSGHDWIKGNRGDDCIDGGEGNDLIAGGNGADTITGGAGYDVIWGQNSNDWLYGDDDDDIIFGGNGDDNIFGGAGDDVLSGDSGQDNIFGGDGNDWIFGGNGADMLIGDDGNDLIFGGNGADLIDGGEGNDLLAGGNGNDAIDGGAGDDIIFGGQGNDSIDGGDGMDIIFENFDWFFC